ncbi:hypothetical protein A3B87_00615 [Candidatus Kuenenbacteria bacterium RIFCSPHIGHO2_02_FULL_39_13]|uniref:Polymerase beta nucleotidyltransferase domain-containing protein n=1 Tax=Candidatus Kuenenbacteria bacterium RIFCSPHIGHO2_02_FULL_39_13 TaxID=1798561 RepID=A0A1F6FP30_9BACT|nr:MAG: hypothetical protein A3B87_00615 [Candidatus Kuenenbacteria bacterium RIFCSPHIGHO2_02_FULL_39_13]
MLSKSKTTRKLLAFYFTNPQAKKYVRQLARVLGLDAGNLSKELKKFETQGLFLSTRNGDQKIFYLNKNYHLFEEYKNIILKTEGIEASLKKLLSQFKKIEQAYIFGSFADNSQRTDSDIDLLVIGQVDFGKLNRGINQLEKKLQREINQVVYSSQEFQAQKRKSPFLKNILRNKKVILIGQDETK